MNILYITSSLTLKANSASIRNVGLINGLVSNGVSVDVITIKWPSHMIDYYLENTLSEKVSVNRKRLITIDKYFGINYKNEQTTKQKQTLSSTIKSLFKKHITDLFFFPDIDKEWIYKTHSNEVHKKYDLVISSSDTKTSHYIAKKLMKSKIASKWIQIWGDPWAEDIGISGLRKIRAKRAEMNMIKLADQVFYVSVATLTRMKEVNSNYAKKMSHLPRGYIKEIIGKEKCNKGYFTVSYTGKVDEHRNINNLIEAVLKYNDISNNKFKIELYGSCDTKTLEYIKKYDAIVKWNGKKGLEEIFNVYENTDALLFIANDKGAHQIPGKLFDYFGTDKSILSVVSDNFDMVTEYIESTNRTIVSENKVTVLTKALKRLEKDILEKEQAPLRKYSGHSIAKELLDKIKY